MYCRDGADLAARNRRAGTAYAEPASVLVCVMKIKRLAERTEVGGQANEILRKASVYFAMRELDRRPKP